MYDSEQTVFTNEMEQYKSSEPEVTEGSLKYYSCR